MGRLCREKKIRLLVFGNPSVEEGLIEEKPEEKDDGKVMDIIYNLIMIV